MAKVGSMGRVRLILSALILSALLMATSFSVLSASPIHGNQAVKTKISAYLTHAPIMIIGNSDFTPSNGVTSGSGTASNPYIIENWEIASASANGIEVKYATVHFIVRNCYVHDSVGNGINIYSCENADVKDNICTLNGGYGTYLEEIYGHNITGNTCSGNNDTGLYLDYCDGNTVTDNICCDNFYYWGENRIHKEGMLIFGSNGNVFRNNTCSNDSYGVNMQMADSNVFRNNTYSNNKYGGMYIGESHGTILRNNTFVNGGISFYIYAEQLEDWTTLDIDTSNTVNSKPIYYCKFQSGGMSLPSQIGQIVLVNCSNLRLENLNISNASCGIWLSMCNNITVSNNTLSNNSEHGITLLASSDNYISNNTCYGNDRGISIISHSHNNTISHNYCYNNRNHGIEAHSFSTNNEFSDNTCFNNGYAGLCIGSNDSVVNENSCLYNSVGILVSGDGNIVFNNSCIYNEDGMTLHYCENNSIFNNDCSHSSFDGIDFEMNAYYNSIWGNNCSDNTYYCIRIRTSCSHNRIWNNTFYQYNAYDEGTSNWWNSTSGYGNWWSSWQTPDVLPPFGIVDTPKSILGTAGSKDYYPITTYNGSSDDNESDDYNYSYEAIFFDDFEFGTLGGSSGHNWTTTDSNMSGVGTQTSRSGVYSMYTGNGAVAVTSCTIDLSGQTGARLLCWIKQGDYPYSEDPDYSPSEDLVIEYRSVSSSWVILEQFPASDPAGTVYFRNYVLPIDALHSNFQVRFRQLGGSGGGCDYWHIDDVLVSKGNYPTVTITAPTTNATMSTSWHMIFLSGTASDNAKVTSVAWNNSLGGSGTAYMIPQWGGANVTWQSRGNVLLYAGYNVITVTAFDDSNNSATDTLIVIYLPPEASPPTCMITAPTTNTTMLTNWHMINLRGVATDNFKVTSVTWSNSLGGSGIAYMTPQWGATSVTWQNRSNIQLFPGINVITVTAIDANNNNATDTLSVIYDNTPPTCIITTPTSNPTYETDSTTITLAGTASDAWGVASIAWKNMATGVSGTAAKGNASWSATGITLNVGINLIYINATDNSGNKKSDAIFVTCSPPSSAYLFDAESGEDGWTHGAYSGPDLWHLSQSHSYSLTHSWRDADDVQDNYEFNVIIYNWLMSPVIDLSSTTDPQLSFMEMGASEIGWDYSAVFFSSNGGADWTQVAADYFVNSAWIERTYRVSDYVTVNDQFRVMFEFNTQDEIWNAFEGWFIDDVRISGPTAPTVIITAPTSNATMSTDWHMINLRGTATDNLKVTSVIWNNSRGGSGIAYMTPQIGGTNVTWQSRGNIQLFTGVNVITVTAYDGNGHTAKDNLTVTYNPPVSPPPTCTITIPTTDTVMSTSWHMINLGGVATDNIKVTSVTWNNSLGGSGIAYMTPQWGAASVTWQSRGNVPLSVGTNVITVTTHDADNNSASDVLIVIYYPPELTAPTVTITTPTNNSVMNTSWYMINLGGIAIDNRKVINITWNNSRGGSGIAYMTPQWGGPSVSWVSRGNINLSSGINVITVTAYDSDGNTATDCLIVTCTYYGDFSVSPPWYDDFELGLFGGITGYSWTTTNSNRSGVGWQTSNSGTYSMFTLGGAVTVTSCKIDLSGESNCIVSFWLRQGGAFSENPDGGENMVVEYRNDAGSWVALATYLGSDAAGTQYNGLFALPSNALHSNFQLRFRQTAGSGYGFDYWHIDDVYVGAGTLSTTKFLPPHSDYGNDTNGNGMYDLLTVDVRVNVTSNGWYQIYGDLYNGLGNWTDGDMKNVYLMTGLNIVSLSFSGLDIYNCGVNGPYNVNLSLYDYSSNLLDSDSYVTSSYTYDEFEAYIGLIASQWAAVSPTIDGIFTPGEWADATSVNLTFVDSNNQVPAILLVKNDADYLYICYDGIGDNTSNDNDGASISFDTGNDGVLSDGGEDQFAIGWPLSTPMNHAVFNSSSGWVIDCQPFNTTLPDHAGLSGAFGFNSSDNSLAYHRIYEFRIPLALLGVTSGDTIGFAGSSQQIPGIADNFIWSAWPKYVTAPPSIDEYGDLALA
jgi:parallel beta-helix repeat protein